MPLVRSEEVTALHEYTALIESLRMPEKPVLWYRGCARISYRLIPSLYRNSRYTTAEQFAKLEIEILTRFKQRSIPYQTRIIIDDWDYLFLMQHYAVPTRLLDWSENPYIALYFALSR